MTESTMPLELDREIPDQETRRWAMFLHLGGLVGIVVFPIGNVALPFILWMAKRNEHPYLDVQGREVVNFQISMVLYILTLGLAIFILKAIFIGYLFVWVPVLLWIALVGGSIIGAIRAYDGENFRFPFILRFV